MLVTFRGAKANQMLAQLALSDEKSDAEKAIKNILVAIQTPDEQTQCDLLIQADHLILGAITKARKQQGAATPAGILFYMLQEIFQPTL